ncbi:MAG: DNA internalization-related competence protein ComEC/Rec2, partial [Bacillus sp. (in: Bacteria)]|nr:DNA internalization-related competence protein ComEC/Rec2 [Bacillus sp. (in: firmicutes)]
LTYYVRTEEEKTKWSSILQPNTVCTVNGTLKTPPEPTNPNAFNYRQYLRTQNIKYLISVDTIRTCQKGKETFYTNLLKYREQSMALINHYFPERIAPFINALLFGNDDQMEETTAEAYRQLGLSHLLAISGLHVTIISGCVYFILLRLGISRESVRTGMLCFLPIYAVISGAAPSVIRAVVMAWLVLFLSRWKTVIHPVDALAISFIIFVFINPFILYHVGFQLSYLVTFGLLLSKSLFERTKSSLENGFWIALLSQLVALPVLLNYFYEFSFLSIFLNIIYVPLFSAIILPLCLLTYFLLSLFPAIGQLGVNLLTLIFSNVNRFAEWVYQFDIFHIVLGRPPLILFLAFFIFYFIGFALLERDGLKKKNLLITLFVVPVCLQIFMVKFSPVGEVTFIDVGQGDSILIRLPFNQGNYLIDTGGKVTFPLEDWQERRTNFDPGEDIVVPFLKSRGISKIDKLILTHGDSDHTGSALAILENFRIGQVLVGDTREKKEIELNIINEAKKRGIPITKVSAGMQWEEAGHKFFIIAPEKAAVSSNDASICIYSKLGGQSWLFTGDLEEIGEREVIEQFPQLEVDVLKVGHHGSKTSTTELFLSKIKPEFGVISAGRDNRYGHPHQEVLERLNAHKVMIYRTDIHGAVTYKYFLNRGNFSTVLQDP